MTRNDHRHTTPTAAERGPSVYIGLASLHYRRPGDTHNSRPVLVPVAISCIAPSGTELRTITDALNEEIIRVYAPVRHDLAVYPGVAMLCNSLDLDLTKDEPESTAHRRHWLESCANAAAEYDCEALDDLDDLTR